MQVAFLTDSSKYLLSVFWCLSLLIKVCKQAQSTQDLSSQSTQRCDCSFSSMRYLSLSPKTVCEVCWLLMLLWDALPSCMLSHFLPAGNPNRGGFSWSPAPHNCTTHQLSSQALSYSARNAVAGCWAQQGLWGRATAAGRPSGEGAVTPLCSELRRRCQPAAATLPHCTVGLLSAVLQMWQVCQLKASSIGRVTVKKQFI